MRREGGGGGGSLFRVGMPSSPGEAGIRVRRVVLSVGVHVPNRCMVQQ